MKIGTVFPDNGKRSLPAIYGQRIDLSYPAATPADQATINNAGGLLKTAPYLVHLTPTLRLSETVSSWM